MIEVLIVVAVSGIVVSGVVMLIKLVSDSLNVASTKIELQQYARQAMSVIARDLKSARASSIGNVGYNSGFERPVNIAITNSPPAGWQNPLPYNVQKIDARNPNLSSGFFAMALDNPTNFAYTTNYETTYESYVSTIPLSGAYLLTGWIKSTGKTAIHLLRGDGMEFGTGISTGTLATDNYWSSLSLTIPLTAGTFFKIRLENKSPGSMAYFDDISLSPLHVVFDQRSGSGEYRYERLAGLRDVSCRLYYDREEKSLYHQVWSGTNWVNDGANPVCRYVKSLMVINTGQKIFTVRLLLAKEYRAGKEIEYSVDIAMTPTMR